MKLFVWICCLATWALFPSLRAQTSQPTSDRPAAATTLDTLKQYVAGLHASSLLHPQEKVWLHFDNAGYFAGDTIWFKAYLHSTALGASVPLSRTLYVDLVAPTGRVLYTRKLKVEDGVCWGDLPLNQVEGGAREVPMPLTAGFYEVRAYTRMMLNQGVEGAFSRVFPVYDAPGFAGDYQTRMTPSREPFDNLRPQSDEGKAMEVSFYPEGGHLVQGMPCRVAFRVVDAFGNPLEAEGTFDSGDGSSTAVRTLHDGMGMLIYTPIAGQKAQLILHSTAVSEGKNKERSFALPDAEVEGCALYVDNRRADRFVVTVQASPHFCDRLLGLSVQQEGNLYYSDTLRLVAGVPIVRSFPAALFPTGVCQLTLFDSAEPLSERLLFVSNPADSLRLPLDITLTTSQPLRSDASCPLTIQTSRPDGTPCPATLSVAIRDAETTGAISVTEDPRISLLLASEVKGYIHRPEYYFRSDDVAHRQALDLLLMVQGWRRYDWQRMAYLDATTSPYYREEGLILNGYVYNKRGRRPVPNKNIQITMHNADRSLTLRGSCMSDSVGNFNFLFDDFYDRWEMTIHPEEEQGKPTELQYRLDRNIAPPLRPYAAAETILPGAAPRDTSIHRSLDQEQRLATVEVQAHKQRKQGLHLCLDVDREANRLADQGIRCYDVETLLDELNVGVDRWEEPLITIKDTTEEARKQLDTFVEHVTLWGGEANVICANRAETSFARARHLTETAHWPMLLPIGEVKEIELYDISFMLHADSLLRNVYSDSIVSQLMASEDPLSATDPYLIQLRRQREQRESVKALILVRAKNRLEQRSAPKGYRLTYYEGYYRPQTFSADYSRRAPSGEDVRRTLYWNPDLTTDSCGAASLTFRTNSSHHPVTFSVAGLSSALTPPSGGIPTLRSMTLGIAE